MKKTWQKMTVLLIIPLLVVSVMICCCLANTVQAVETSSSCHPSEELLRGDDTSGHAGSTQPGEDCECVHADSILISKIVAPVKLIENTFSNGESILPLTGIVNEAFSNKALMLAYQGPPKTALSSLPVYLQNSNLQL